MSTKISIFFCPENAEDYLEAHLLLDPEDHAALAELGADIATDYVAPEDAAIERIAQATKTPSGEELPWEGDGYGTWANLGLTEDGDDPWGKVKHLFPHQAGEPKSKTLTVVRVDFEEVQS